MDKNIQKHEQYIKDQIKLIEDDIKQSNKITSDIKDKVENLYNFHNDSIHNFQHERFIHLIVTLFFASLLILSFILPFFLSSITSISNSFTTLSTLLFIISSILLITEIFYIKYYFELENGTQRLYKYLKTIYQLKTRD